MTNINDIYELLQFVCAKKQRGYISPSQFNRALNAVQLQLFKEKVGLPEQYQPGRPVPPIAYAVTQKIADDMDPFVVKDAPMATSTWVKPDDFVHPISISSVSASAGPREVQLLPHNEVASRMASSLLFPTEEFPIAESAGRTITCHPGTVSGVRITYLRLPAEARWAHTLVSNRFVYDPVGSKDPEWPKVTWNELFTRTLSLFGENLKGQDVVQFAQMKKQEGM